MRTEETADAAMDNFCTKFANNRDAAKLNHPSADIRKRKLWMTVVRLKSKGVMKVTIQYLCHITELVVDADDHGEGGAEGDDARHGVCPGSLAVLYLHPAVNIVSWSSRYYR